MFQKRKNTSWIPSDHQTSMENRRLDLDGSHIGILHTLRLIRWLNFIVSLPEAAMKFIL